MKLIVVLVLGLLVAPFAVAPEYSAPPIPDDWKLHCITYPTFKNFTACDYYQTDIAAYKARY